MSFYDQDWRELSKKFPLAAKKIEELRCEVVAYEQYELEIEALRRDIKELQDAVVELAKLNGLKRPVAVVAKSET